MGLKYRRSGQLAWTDIAAHSTLFILKDTVVEFGVAATLVPITFRFESTSWTGTAFPAGGAGSVNSITFTSVTANLVAPFNLVVALSGQSFQLDVVVFTLQAVSTPADNFALRSQDDLGVDEEVDLGFTTTPAGITPLQAGGLLWTVGTGAIAVQEDGGLLRNPLTHTAPPLGDGHAEYIAPCRTSPPGVIGASSKVVNLKLSVLAGPSAGLGVLRVFRVHKPTAHMRKMAGQVHHFNQGAALPSAGFYGEIMLSPLDVSFRTLRWRESSGIMEGWGAAIDGEVGLVHAPTVWGSPIHGTINGGNAVTGCTVNQRDTVRGVALAYPAPPRLSSGTTKVGGKSWPIHWEYTYLDRATNANGPFIPMQLAHHVATLYENGRMSIFKGHVGALCAFCMSEPASAELTDAHFWP